MSDVLREVVLIAATLTTGLMAGVFGHYSNAIMPGLSRTDGRTFVAAFRRRLRRHYQGQRAAKQRNQSRW